MTHCLLQKAVNINTICQYVLEKLKIQPVIIAMYYFNAVLMLDKWISHLPMRQGNILYIDHHFAERLW